MADEEKYQMRRMWHLWWFGDKAGKPVQILGRDIMQDKCVKCRKVYCLCRTCPNNETCRYALRRKCKGVEYCGIRRRIMEDNDYVSRKKNER